MKLSKKLCLAFGLLLVLACTVVVIYHETVIGVRSRYTQLLETEDAMYNRAQAVSYLLLQCRRNEKDFLLRKDVQYPEKVEANCSRLIQEAQTIADIARNADLAEARRQADAVIDLVKSYRQAFRRVVDGCVKAGLDHESGLQGEFRAIAHELQAWLERYDTGELLADLLVIHRWEEAYIRTGQESQKTQLQSAIDAYRAELESGGYEDSAMNTQSVELANYAAALDDLSKNWDDVTAKEKSLRKVRDASAATEHALLAIHIPNARALLLEIRRREKDYLLRGDDKYKTLCLKAIQALRTQIQGSQLPPWRVQRASDKLGKYEKLFLKMAAQNEEIARLLQEMRATAQKVEPAVREIRAEALKVHDKKNDAIQRTASRNSNISLAIAAVNTALGALVLLFVFRMTTKLESLTLENEKQDWIKTGDTLLNDQMRGEQQVNALLGGIITFVAKRVDAQVGAIYLVDGKDRLRLAGSYAYTRRKSHSNELELGEGLVGQAALEKEAIVFTNAPDDYIAISSGIGEAAPRNIMVLPFQFDGEVKGVIELGSFTELSDTKAAFLDHITEDIGIAVNLAQSRQKLQELLEETQAQSEELQTQQEELKQANEELAEQTEALKQSEQRLQAQQEELRQTNEELEERTEALEEERNEVRRKNSELETAKQMVEEKAMELALTSKYKSEFLANMSHELRTPLNSMLILSKLLMDNKDGNLAEKQMEFAQTINSSGAELLTLINEILDLSKIESGRMTLVIEKVSLRDLLADLEEQFKHVADESGLDFPVHLAEDAPAHIQTDGQRLRQIVNNLLSNAFKFTSEGSVSLNIGRPALDTKALWGQLDLDQTIAITVTDTGIGIPSDKQKIIFEAFQQADGATVRKYGGTGLGLAISRELVNLLGGEIRMESEAGKGSSFTIFLPETLPEESAKEEARQEPDEAATKPLSSGGDARQAAASHDPEPVSAPRDPAGNQTHEQKAASVESLPDDRNDVNPGDRSILIIEDDPKFARILLDQAHERGLKCLAASEGKAGLQLAERYNPSGILLDLGLPDMDGMSVMDRLKEDLTTRHIPVHIISGHEKEVDAMKMGAVGFLLKPVNMEQINDAFRKIESLISGRVKNLLVVEDDETARNSIAELISEDDVDITAVSTGKEALERMKTTPFDCTVLDLALPDMSGIELLDQMRADDDLAHVPVVVFTGKELSKEEKTMLDKYAERIVVKGVNSPERLLDETALFLHRVEKDLPAEKRRKVQMLHDKEAIFKEKTLLLVDDDMRNVFALSSVLEAKGLKLVVAKNGREAVDCLDNNGHVDLVLMDIMMPEMDGYEAMREIRKRGRFRKLPIIALTAKAMKGDRATCIEAGASDYLAKPVDTDKLLSMLRVWLYQ